MISKSLVSKFLIFFNLFIALTAFAGGYGLVFMDGLGMPTDFLSGSPFKDYFWPGVILFFVVGGIHFASAILLTRKHSLAPEAVGVAGFSMLIWIFTELFITHVEKHPVHPLYFGFGILNLLGAALIKFYLRDKK